MTVQFPHGFMFGTATAAYQIEGASAEDGKQDSIWDVFCREPGRIANGEDGNLACDHYHRYVEDVALMADLGLNTYRFSVSWPRVMSGSDINVKGMDFYSRLVDELLGKGITPWLTLYHWDLPASLVGGWTNRDTAKRFVDYAKAVHDRLGDRVRTWTTLNEPWCSAFLGHASGVHAPGLTDPSASLRAAHHLMLAHGLAVRALRSADVDAKLGITLNFTPTMPASGDLPDIDVARRIDGTANRFFADAIFKGRYPSDIVADLGSTWPAEAIHDGDLEDINAPIDVLGVNYYTTNVFRAGDGVEEVAHPSPHVAALEAVQVLRDLPLTSMGWEVEPSGLHRLLRRLHDDYTGASGTEIVITENGAAFDDRPDANGVVDDTADRLDFIRRHLLAAHQALAEGVNLRGYLAWSLIDNFEWSYGYDKRFGIVRVDENLNRIPKASALWYAEVARTGLVQTKPLAPVEPKNSPEAQVSPAGSEETPKLPEPPSSPSSADSYSGPSSPESPQLPASPWSADAPELVEDASLQLEPDQQPSSPETPQLPASPWSADTP